MAQNYETTDVSTIAQGWCYRPGDKLLTPREANPLLGGEEGSDRTARQYIAERRIGYVKLGKGRRSPVRIPESAIAEFLAKHYVAPQDGAA